MEALKCQICKFKFDLDDRRPHTLVKCSHTYCSSCIESELSANGKKEFKCPIDFYVNESIDSSLDFHLNLKLIQAIKDTMRMGCIEHNRKFEFFCLEDENEICPLCGLFGEHKGHTIIVHKELEELVKNMFQEITVEKTKIEISEELKKGEEFQSFFRKKLNESLKNCKKQIEVLYQVK